MVQLLKDSVRILIHWNSKLFHSFSKKNPATLKNLSGGGIVLSFDDLYLQDWLEADQHLKPFAWKATFFISNLEHMDAKGFDRLKQLQRHGHEIAAHGYKHLDAVEFTNSASPEKYLAEEIEPFLAAMKTQGLHIDSFAYPYGTRNEATDRVLLKQFDILRGTTYGMRPLHVHDNYANGSRLVFGLGIDLSSEIEINYILKVLKYAQRKNKIVLFYGHNIQRDAAGTYTTSFDRLETICRYVVDHKMTFLTFRELSLKRGDKSVPEERIVY
jgi:peptidoglycan/xylan/chitin deacetylase (PgdA/CDA1 family)